MKTRQIILAVLALMMLAMLAACGGSGSSTSTTTQPISVSLGTPPASMAESATAAFTATVSNDSVNAGVTWTVSCGAANCGSFAASNSASGASNNFTAPPTIPAGGVTITATSVSDGTKKAAASVTITAASSLADGTYVFSLAGQNLSGALIPAYRVAGAFTVSSGSITAGEQDYNDYTGAFHPAATAITGGTASTTADGNLQIVLNTSDSLIGPGQNGVETINGTLVSGVRALITGFDSSETSSGELDLQTSIASPAGAYAFYVSGGDAGAGPAGIGGVMNVDGVGTAGATTISGTGSVFDLNDEGNIFGDEPIDAGVISAPDSFGRFTIGLNLTTSTVGGIGLVGYTVDGSRIRLVENNNDNTYDVFFGVTGGTAFAQGSSASSFSVASLQSTSLAFGTNGADVNGYLVVSGVFNFNADGTTVTGVLNYNDFTCLCTTGSPQPPIAFQGTYTVDATGRVTLSNLTDGVNFSFNMQLYLDGAGHATALSVDGTDEVAGLAFLQTSGSSFVAGTYGLNVTGYGIPPVTATVPLGPELDGVGPVVSDGISTLAGTVDLNALGGTPTAGIALTDGYAATANSGVFTGTLTGLDITTAPPAPEAFSYYVVDSTRAFAIQTDDNQLTLGYFELQQ